MEEADYFVLSTAVGASAPQRPAVHAAHADVGGRAVEGRAGERQRGAGADAGDGVAVDLLVSGEDVVQDLDLVAEAVRASPLGLLLRGNGLRRAFGARPKTLNKNRVSLSIFFT